MVGGVGVLIVTDEGFEVGTVALLLLLLLPLLLFPQLLTAKAISDIRTRLIDRMCTPMISFLDMLLENYSYQEPSNYIKRSVDF